MIRLGVPSGGLLHAVSVARLEHPVLKRAEYAPAVRSDPSVSWVLL